MKRGRLTVIKLRQLSRDETRSELLKLEGWVELNDSCEPKKEKPFLCLLVLLLNTNSCLSRYPSIYRTTTLGNISIEVV